VAEDHVLLAGSRRDVAHGGSAALTQADLTAYTVIVLDRTCQ